MEILIYTLYAVMYAAVAGVDFALVIFFLMAVNDDTAPRFTYLIAGVSALLWPISVPFFLAGIFTSNVIQFKMDEAEGDAGEGQPQSE